MVKRGRGVVCLLCTAVVISMISAAAAQDRINGDLASAPRVQLGSNVHSLARPENDLGRADGNRLIERISLNFRPSPAQQQDLDQFLAELADRSSPNYHKYLTPAQFAKRFGMSDNDVNKVVSWIESLGFTNIKVAKNRNRITFDGTVAQLESVFALEMHHYLIDGEVHLANSMNPSVPAALSGAVQYVGHLNDFAPKPRAKVRPNFTSYVSGNHFLTPADFKTIYDLNGLGDGTGQKIAIVGQSTVNPTDIANFRSAAGLSPSTFTLPAAMEGTATRCSGDEGESDLDLEWAGGVATNATIKFVYAGLGSGDTCTARRDSVWDALQKALETAVAPFVSTSYGFCEPGLQAQQPGFAATIRTSVQNGQALGVTLVSASGDAGAADCDTGASATRGLAVDVPSSIPETTAMGGTEFSADSPTNPPNAPKPPGGNPPYWLPAGTTTDTGSSAQVYIPETAWNDTSLNNTLSATGGGASILFSKPAWQGGTGTMRLVPDVSLSASADHDPYLFCSEDDQQTGQIVSTCTAGFRTGAGGNLTAVGGTSADAPTFAAILALINQFLGTPSLAPVNPTLYSVAASTPSAFHDIKTGNNMVPCTAPSTNCPTGTTQIGFSAAVGYDEVTGLGSVDALVLAQAMGSAPGFTLAPKGGVSTLQLAQGSPGNMEIDLTQINGFNGAVTYTCSDPASESTCTGPSSATNSTAVSFAITTKAPIARLERPFDRGSRILYATLLPGLFGIVFVASSRKRSLRSVRFLGLVMVLGFSTIWLGSCGGSSSGPKDPGTPVGSYTITVTGTSGSLTRQTSFTLVVVK